MSEFQRSRDPESSPPSAPCPQVPCHQEYGPDAGSALRSDALVAQALASGKMTFELQNNLHVLPSTLIAKACLELDVAVSIRNPDGDPAVVADAKSPIFLLALGATKGSSLEVLVSGKESEKAWRNLLALELWRPTPDEK